MRSKENLFKGRTFSVGSEIGEGQISFPATVLESYGNLCLVEVKKAYEKGPFSEFRIFNVGLTGSGEEMLVPAPINFETKEGVPARRMGTEEETRAIFERMVSKMVLQDSEAELSKDRQIKSSAAKEEAVKLKADNLDFVANKLTEANSKLKEWIEGQPAGKALKQNEVRDLIAEILLLEKFQTILKHAR
jgi:hypothetical protein